MARAISCRLDTSGPLAPAAELRRRRRRRARGHRGDGGLAGALASLIALIAASVATAGSPLDDRPAAVAVDPPATVVDSATGVGRRSWRSPLRCEQPFPKMSDWLRSDASIDLYNGLAYLGVAGTLSVAGRPSRHWSAVNSLDDEIRSDFRFTSPGARKDADFASDVLLGASFAALPVLSIVAHQSRTGDCVESLDMLTDLTESFGLALLVTESVKLAAGRARPYSRECGVAPPGDSRCRGSDRFSSFISGHASLAAAGAGITCAFSIERQAWGASPMARAMPCGLGIASALAVGGLRLASDRHWFTDIAVGFLVGGTIGYFDTWGPFDLLRFEKKDAAGRTAMRGVLLPGRIDDHFGARLVLVF